MTEHLRDAYYSGTEELSPNERRVYPESVIIKPVNNRSSINDT
jgi:hypothetical protein